ncbi:hypothetical protein AAF712_013658 [Marasmius tenuissimus]|uniref:F-box domain-containing protein n=1 Tax=Marasmius tenuissimus TaxID=585030 RepID=A0ABR2ZGL1_9AGAR
MTDESAQQYKCCRFVPKYNYPPISNECFRSEYLLSSATLDEISMNIAHEEEELERYDTEINRLVDLLGVLENEMEALQARVDRRKSFISITRRLPEELWVEIFSHCIFPTSEPSSSTTPFRLSAVCSRWREILTSAPKLWSAFGLTIYLRGAIHVPAVEFHLSRCKGQPLDVFITKRLAPCLRYSGQGDSTTTEGAVAIRDEMISQLMKQTQKLTILKGSVSSKSPLDALPLLEHLSIGRLANELSSSFYEALRHASQLHDVVLHSSSEHLPVHFRELRSSSVRSLTILEVGMCLRELVNVLPELGKLESLTLKRVYGKQMSEPPPVVCPRLQHLSIHFDNDNLINETLLQSFTIPHLRSLALHYSGLVFDTGGLDTTLCRFSASLTRLSLSACFTGRSHINAEPKNDVLRRILHSLPNITVFEARLKLPQDRIEPSLSDLCKALSETLPVASRLQSLLLSTEDEITLQTFKHIVRALEARFFEIGSGDSKSLTDVCVAVKSRGVEGFKAEMRSRLRNPDGEGMKCIICIPADTETSSTTATATPERFIMVAGKYGRFEKEILSKHKGDGVFLSPSISLL